MDVRVGAEHLAIDAGAPEELERTVGYHFIRVHVGRRPRATLDHVDAEMLVMKPVADFPARGDDGPRQPRLEQPKIPVRLGGRFLYSSDCAYESREFTKLDAADREILHRPQRLNTIEGCLGHVPIAEEVMFATRCREEVEDLVAGCLCPFRGSFHGWREATTSRSVLEDNGSPAGCFAWKLRNAY